MGNLRHKTDRMFPAVRNTRSTQASPEQDNTTDRGFENSAAGFPSVEIAHVHALSDLQDHSSC